MPDARARGAPGAGMAGGALVALASVQFGAVVVLGKTATDHDMPVAPMLAIRFAVAALLLAGMLAARGLPLLPPRGERAPLVALGAVAYAGEAGLFFLALDRGTASAVTLLFFSYPVWVTVVVAPLGAGVPGPVVVGALAATLAGVSVVLAGSGELAVSASGAVLALCSAVTFAAYVVVAERVLRRTPSLVASMWVSAAAALTLGSVAAFVPGTRLPSGGQEWWSILGMALLTAGAFLCLFEGLRRVGAVRTSIIASLEPATAATLSAIFLSEPLRAPTLAGGTLIVAGAIAAGLARAGTRVEISAP